MLIRPQTVKDNLAIECLTIDAFKDHPFSNQTEQHIVNALRHDNSLAVSLVAEENGIVVGHIAFSLVSITNADSWFGLGPVSVSPEYQNQGIGSSLIKEGLLAIKKLTANGCVVLGDPLFYQRFGFSFIKQIFLAGVPADHFQAQLFAGELPSGEVSFNTAFEATGE